MERSKDGKKSTKSGKEIQVLNLVSALTERLMKPLYEPDTESDWDQTSESESEDETFDIRPDEEIIKSFTIDLDQEARTSNLRANQYPAAGERTAILLEQ